MVRWMNTFVKGNGKTVLGLGDDISFNYKGTLRTGKIERLGLKTNGETVVTVQHINGFKTYHRSKMSEVW